MPIVYAASVSNIGGMILTKNTETNVNTVDSLICKRLITSASTPSNLFVPTATKLELESFLTKASFFGVSYTDCCYNICPSSSSITCGNGIFDDCGESCGTGTKCNVQESCVGEECCSTVCPLDGPCGQDLYNGCGSFCKYGTECNYGNYCGISGCVPCPVCDDSSTIACGVDYYSDICRNYCGKGTSDEGCTATEKCKNNDCCDITCGNINDYSCGSVLPLNDCGESCGKGINCPLGYSCSNNQCIQIVCDEACPSNGPCGQSLINGCGNICGTGTLCGSGEYCDGTSCWDCPECEPRSWYDCGESYTNSCSGASCGTGTYCYSGVCKGGECCDSSCPSRDSESCGVSIYNECGSYCYKGISCDPGFNCERGSCVQVDFIN